MPLRYIRVVIALLFAGVLLTALAAPATAASLAGAFAVPPGFVVVIEDQHTSEARAGSEAGREVLTIRPDPGPFAGFSTLTLRVIDHQIEDPEEWLRRRMRIDTLSGEDLSALLESPDSPFGAPAFDRLREAMPDVSAGLDRLARIPLDDCEGPERRTGEAGPLFELRCEHAIGPFKRFTVLRLQQVGEMWYGIDIVAANPQRLRHLIAIANSFDPDVPQ